MARPIVANDPPSAPLPPPGSIRLVMRSVSKRFGATTALEGVDLEVRAGSVHALVGENGAGKSTLMKILSGVFPPDRGSLELDGRPLRPQSPLDARRSGVVMIYQELALAPHLSVMENILLGTEPTRGPCVSFSRMRSRALQALREVGAESIDPLVRAADLPLAGRQMVEIARAVAMQSTLLVLDEPTSSLTREDTERLFQLIRRLKAQGRSIVYISHFLEEVQQISDEVTVLRDGRNVGHCVTSQTTAAQIVALMVGRRVEQLYPRSVRTAGEPVLELRGLSGKARPLDASLVVHRGEVLGIAGLIGAGRTELVRAVMGLDPVVAGRIRVKSWTGPATPHRRWSQGVGMVSEDRKAEGLAQNLSIADNVTLPKLERLGPWPLVTRRAQELACREWIDKLPIRCRSPRQRVAALSGGNQQKVALARLLYHGADVWLLDEPTRGIDIGSKAQIYDWIDRLVAGGGGQPAAAVLLISSYLPELLGICDRIAVMRRGSLGPARPVIEWDEHRLMWEATGQEAPA
jgi:ribose transport system ATP-binding protein